MRLTLNYEFNVVTANQQVSFSAKQLSDWTRTQAVSIVFSLKTSVSESEQTS